MCHLLLFENTQRLMAPFNDIRFCYHEGEKGNSLSHTVLICIFRLSNESVKMSDSGFMFHSHKKKAKLFHWTSFSLYDIPLRCGKTATTNNSKQIVRCISNRVNAYIVVIYPSFYLANRHKLRSTKLIMHWNPMILLPCKCNTFTLAVLHWTNEHLITYK